MRYFIGVPGWHVKQDRGEVASSGQRGPQRGADLGRRGGDIRQIRNAGNADPSLIKRAIVLGGRGFD